MRYLYLASAFLIILAIYITRSSDNISNNDLPKEVRSAYLLEENIISPNGEIDYYYFADPPMDINLSGSMSCNDGTSYDMKITGNETVPEKHPLKENDNMFVLESKVSTSVYDDSGVSSTEYDSSTEVYNEEGALSLISWSDGTVCVPLESQAVPEIVRVGDSGNIATLRCSDDTQQKMSWSISKRNGIIMASHTLRIDNENLDTFQLLTMEHNYKNMSIRGIIESGDGECEMNMSGSWKSLWWDMNPSWKE